MLSYLHGYHAGNFADVHKHIIFVCILHHLRQKETPFCYLETHAGRGVYDLASAQARKTREAEGGIGKLWPGSDAPEAAQVYLDAIRAQNEGSALRSYPGSPALARQLFRKQDRMILMERHPAEFPLLKAHFDRNRQVAVHRRDGYEGLGGLVPPKEKRGIVLIDPSYEVKKEYGAVAELLARSHNKWPTGIYMIWYPLLADAYHHAMVRQIERSGIRRILHCQLRVRENSGKGMYGSGVLVINPPWPLSRQLQTMQPWLAAKCGMDGKSSSDLHWLVEE